MISTLRESKARLSEWVERASRGEDVLITVRGRVKAKLTRVAPASESALGETWARELRAIQRRFRRGQPRASIDRILNDLREDRL
jgi:prevent-host-death family protein